MMPTDRLTMRSTIFDNSPNEKIAAAEMLKTPDMVVTNRMLTRMVLMAVPNGQAEKSQIIEHPVRLTTKHIQERTDSAIDQRQYPSSANAYGNAPINC
ncbi:hypothetical protein QN370_04360 [Actimicrobium sp. CCI2.3]|nr:hypothetical protein [Actimicrobium sp. CCI2.3]